MSPHWSSPLLPNSDCKLLVWLALSLPVGFTARIASQSLASLPMFHGVHGGHKVRQKLLTTEANRVTLETLVRR